jgi:hypothetical protein
VLVAAVSKLAYALFARSRQLKLWHIRNIVQGHLALRTDCQGHPCDCVEDADAAVIVTEWEHSGRSISAG